MKKFHLKLSDNNNVIQEIEIIAETSSIAKTKATDATVKLQCAKAAVAGVKEDIKLEKASLKAKK